MQLGGGAFGEYAIGQESDSATQTAARVGSRVGSRATLTVTARLSGCTATALYASGAANLVAPGTALIDFGPAPGTNVSSTSVTGQSGISIGSAVEAWFMGNDYTGSHNSYEHSILPMAVALSVTSITPGIGFTITAVTQLRMTGLIMCRWIWH
jgi:hypothetical protein